MTLITYGTQPWTKANFTLFIITSCVFFHPHSVTSLSARSNHQSNSYSTSQGQQVNTVNETTINGSSSLATHKHNNSSPLESNSSGNGGLLIDPSYPLSPDEVQVLKPSKIISSALLTATTPLPTAPNSSLSNLRNLINHSRHDWNSTRKFPLLSGSMTILLPTATPAVTAPTPTPLVGAATATSNASMSLSTLSSNTVIGFVTVDGNMPSTPTTSTAFVYATNPPTSSSRTSKSVNSASSCTIDMSSYAIINSGLFVFLIMMDYL